MMREPVIDEVVARKFLLGQLSPEEQGQIEELAFKDPDTFTFLESVEEDLVDEFLQDELSQLETQHFEDHFLSFPGRRQDLEISQVLHEHFNPVPAEVIAAEPQDKEAVADDDGRNFFFGWFIDSLKAKSFWLRATTAAAAVALLIIVVWLFREQERQPDPVQAGPGTPVNVPSPEPHVSPSLHPTPSPVQAEKKRRSPTSEKQKPVAPYATLLLPSAAPRGPGAQVLEFPPDASSLLVGLALFNRTNFKTYDVTLENEAGTELDRWSNLKAQRFPATKGLLINLRTSLLNPDESYRIVVTGVSSKGERNILEGYSFEAKNKP